MFCKHCGNDVGESRFCSSCGAAVDSTSGMGANNISPFCSAGSNTDSINSNPFGNEYGQAVSVAKIDNTVVQHKADRYLSVSTTVVAIFLFVIAMGWLSVAFVFNSDLLGSGLLEEAIAVPAKEAGDYYKTQALGALFCILSVTACLIMRRYIAVYNRTKAGADRVRGIVTVLSLITIGLIVVTIVVAIISFVVGNTLVNVLLDSGYTNEQIVAGAFVQPYSTLNMIITVLLHYGWELALLVVVLFKVKGRLPNHKAEDAKE